MTSSTLVQGTFPCCDRSGALRLARVLLLSALATSLISLDFGATRNPNPYTLEKLNENYHLGWQPTVSSQLNSSFSWRECFGVDDKSDRPDGCRENPFDFGSPKAVETDWMPSVTMIRSMLMHGKDRYGNPFPPILDKELCENIGATGGMEGDRNRECIVESNIRSLGALNETTVKIATSNNITEADGDILEIPAPTIMCMVYTLEDAHADRIGVIRDTWAGGCDGFLAFSNISDPRIPAISIEHKGPEAYDNMWQKVRSIWRFAGAHYLDNFDWFLIGGDDLFVLPYNLKSYLASLTHKDGTDPKTKEYFVGRRFKNRRGDYFNSGGAGYVLSQAALRKYHGHLDDLNCNTCVRTSMEDVMTARCLKYLGINFTDTRDSEGRERFHHFPPDRLYHGGHAEWYDAFNNEWGIKLGRNCCAPDSVY